jgi:hypothetical protein
MHTPKIRILSFFISVLLLCTFASCGKDDPYYKFDRKLEALTDEQIEECNSAYREDYFGAYDEYIASKSDDIRDRAEKAYFGMKFIQNNVYTPYLGTFGGAIVVGTSLRDEKEIYMIGSSAFEMGSLKKITVYKNGEFVSLSQAYNSGWLTDEDIAGLSARIEKYEKEMKK